eukprot:6238474-Ditylum_brightwellii.AAC.1
MADYAAGGCSMIYFPPRCNIDEATYSLHTLLSEAGPSPHDMINEEENDDSETLNEVESYGDEYEA